MKKVDFENDTITENIIQTAFPMLVAQVISLLYNIVDRIYIGRIEGYGTQALGAIGLECKTKFHFYFSEIEFTLTEIPFRFIISPDGPCSWKGVHYV